MPNSQKQELGKAMAKKLTSQAVNLRNEESLSQKQVADILGLRSHAGITAMEAGKVIPRLDTFLTVLSVYGCTLQIIPIDNEGEA